MGADFLVVTPPSSLALIKSRMETFWYHVQLENVERERDTQRER